MNRKRFFAFVLGFLLASPGLHVAAADKPLEVAVSALKGPLHLMRGRGGNVVASVGGDGVLLVDDDYGEYGQAYHDALLRLAGAEFKPAFVLNTHWHGDHTGSNGFWANQGAVVMAHSNVRERLAARQDITALPVVTYGDSLVLHFNGDDIEVQHYPRSHTDGDSVVYYSRENVVHMGDLFFKDAFPFVDIGSGGDVAGYIAAVEAVLARVDDSTVIVPGHGTVADRADLVRYHHMLTTTSALVLDALARGMTVAAVTSRGLGEEWASWGVGFIDEARWISFIAAGRPVKPE